MARNLPKLAFICPGNMTANCPGKVGDVLVASGVARRLSEAGYKILFITNDMMVAPLRGTYPGFQVDDVPTARRAPSADWGGCRGHDHVFLLRPLGDKEGNEWQRELASSTGGSHNVHRIGGLNAFTNGGPHIVEQILGDIEPYLRPVALPFPSSHSAWPLLEPRSDDLDNHPQEGSYLILPIAGGDEKCLPLELVKGMVEKLGPGRVVVAATEFDAVKSGRWREITTALSALCPPPRTSVLDLDQMPLLAKGCERVFSVDGGVCWATVSGLNWLVERGRLSRDHFPEVTVILGRDEGWNAAPSARVWRPLAIAPERVRQANPDQAKRLIDLTAADVV